MSKFGTLAHLLTLSLCCGLSADVVVISNRSGATSDFSIQSDRGLVDARLAPDVSRPYFTSGEIVLTIGNSRIAVGKQFPRTSLLPSCVYLLEKDADRIVAKRLDLGGDEMTRKPNPDSPPDGSFVVPVSLWVDDDQLATQEIWESKLRKRFTAAAKVIEEHSGVHFKISHCGRWRSSNRIRVFSGSLYEFIDYVNPENTLAIGFSSQYARPNKDGVLRIAGTRRPLASHILVREWAGSTSEQERVELLVHELGHFLGACHSTEASSAMRSKLSDRPQGKSDTPIRFDAINTLVMSLIGEHLRSLDTGSLALTDLKQLSRQTQLRLRQIYSIMATETPGDPVPPKYLMLLQ